MQGPPTPDAAVDRGESDTWPWRCLDCTGTIYHDGELCRDCASARRRDAAQARSNRPDGFVGWMRGQPLPAFVLKTTTVAGIELALTTVWLQTLLHRSLWIGALPVVG